MTPEPETRIVAAINKFIRRSESNFKYEEKWKIKARVQLEHGGISNYMFEKCWKKSSGPDRKTKFLINLDHLKDDLRNLDDLSRYLEATMGLFSGPSIHFHVRALEECESNFLEPSHLEMIYAVLPAWGMHRMGEIGKDGKNLTKVCDYEKFKEQVVTQEIDDPKNKGQKIEIGKALARYKDKPIAEITDEDIQVIVDLMFAIKVNALESDSQLVSSSKTLHHILPDLVPPIDRAYSLTFMHRTIDAQSDDDCDKIAREKAVASEFITEMVAFIRSGYGSRMKNECTSKFNTSLPKIFDNLIVAFVNCHPQTKNES
ncbi:MAG: hypothetical protein FWC43_00975 [Planctomycetaceae bacterium]|nr:hypothetical protein [Planctomycetaceae bacterium]